LSKYSKTAAEIDRVFPGLITEEGRLEIAELFKDQISNSPGGFRGFLKNIDYWIDRFGAVKDDKVIYDGFLWDKRRDWLFVLNSELSNAS